MKYMDYGFLPKEMYNSHDACFINHDILVQLLKSGEKQSVFYHRINLGSEEEKKQFEFTSDIFDWLNKNNRKEDKQKILRAVVFPALLSDFLHFIYESLSCSKKAKLTLTYSLLRKPIQEILYIFELIYIDLDRFCDQLENYPEKLYSQSIGGIEPHINRVSAVISKMTNTINFDAEYIAKLRYDRNCFDSFDASCNKATHLFTKHPSIKTESLNINFIFSNNDAKYSQWNYLYNRLPYLIVYSRCLIEEVCASIFKTDIVYLEEMERRSSASILLWANNISNDYLTQEIASFIVSIEENLELHCANNNYLKPSVNQLEKMKWTGRFPGERRKSYKKRIKRYESFINK